MYVRGTVDPWIPTTMYLSSQARQGVHDAVSKRPSDSEKTGNSAGWWKRQCIVAIIHIVVVPVKTSVMDYKNRQAAEMVSF